MIIMWIRILTNYRKLSRAPPITAHNAALYIIPEVDRRLIKPYFLIKTEKHQH